jgi:glycosyltransferase involved in cell wall biosynthesis
MTIKDGSPVGDTNSYLPNVLMLTLGHGWSVTGGLGGGTETSGKLLVDRLKAKGLNITVIGYGGDISFVSPPGGLWRIWWSVNAFIMGMASLSVRDFDIIYARYSTYPLFVGVILKFLFGKKLISSIHGGDIRHRGLFGVLVAACLRTCDAIVCYDNPEHVKKLRDTGFNPIVIPNGIDTKEFKPRRRKHSNVHIVYMGGKREIKGYYDFLSAANSDMLSGSKKLKIIIYDDKSIRGSGKCSSGGNMIEHRDPVLSGEVKDIMEMGQLFVLPSHQEGAPGALLQAMSSGMFVIASDLPFTRKIIDRKFLFHAGDPSHMANLMLMFKDHKARYFGDQNVHNRVIVVRDYSIDKTVEKWMELFGRFA